MELVTGHAGTLHITAKQVSRLIRGVTATDESTVQRLNVGNNAAITYSGITMSIASGELLLDGYHVTLVDDTGGTSGETLIFDATLESTNSRIDKVVLEIVQDNTTSYQRAEIVIVQGEESDSPVAPATPTEPESSTEEFLAVGVIAQVTITGDDISSLSDLTNLYGGSYLDLETFNEYVSEISTVNVKNLLPYPYTDTTKTVNGITFTDNGDGTITANGTATDTATFTLGTTSEYLDYDKSYILNGCPVNGSEGTYYIQTDVSNWIDTGSGVEFMRDLSMAGASIVIAEGTTVSNLTFSPMIRLAVIEDDTYEPYAMTNQELTKNVQDIENDISETQDIISDAWSSSKTYAADEYCISGNKLYKCLVANTGTQPPNTTYWEETTCAEEISQLNSNLTDFKTDLNNMHIGYALQTFPTSAGNKYLSFSELVPNYDSSMKYKVFAFKALSRTGNGFSISTDIGSSSGVAVLTECEQERIRLYVDSTGSSYYGTGVSIWYIYMN